jgi:hypothetical protein
LNPINPRNPRLIQLKADKLQAALTFDLQDDCITALELLHLVAERIDIGDGDIVHGVNNITSE